MNSNVKRKSDINMFIFKTTVIVARKKKSITVTIVTSFFSLVTTKTNNICRRSDVKLQVYENIGCRQNESVSSSPKLFYPYLKLALKGPSPNDGNPKFPNQKD